MRCTAIWPATDGRTPGKEMGPPARAPGIAAARTTPHRLTKTVASPRDAIESMGRDPAVCPDWKIAAGLRAKARTYAAERSSGSLRKYLPVKQATALATAGAIGGTPGSPRPVGGSLLGTKCTATGGASLIRGGG